MARSLRCAGFLEATLIALIALVAGAPVVAAANPDETGGPLPETNAFIEEVRQNLRSDRQLLEQYTFTEKRIERRMDGKGRLKKVKSETFEVYPSLEPGKMYRRLVARDDVPVAERELAAQDRKQEARAERAERDQAARDTDRLEEERVVEEIRHIYDVALVGRETVDGHSTILVTFAPKPGYQAVTRGGKFLQKVAGRAWVDEADRQLVRVELTLLDTLGVGPAGVVRLQKGTSSYFHRRKVNGEIWLPAEARFTGAAKVLLFFGGRVDTMFEYSDYRKFSVSTDSTVGTPEPPAN